MSVFTNHTAKAVGEVNPAHEPTPQQLAEAAAWRQAATRTAAERERVGVVMRLAVATKKRDDKLADVKAARGVPAIARCQADLAVAEEARWKLERRLADVEAEMRKR